jgi:hypothetical protein
MPCVYERCSVVEGLMLSFVIIYKIASTPSRLSSATHMCHCVLSIPQPVHTLFLAAQNKLEALPDTFRSIVDAPPFHILFETLWIYPFTGSHTTHMQLQWRATKALYTHPQSFPLPATRAVFVLGSIRFLTVAYVDFFFVYALSYDEATAGLE